MTIIKLTPETWDATPYGEHWSFAYNLANIEREEYDFTVEFHETIDEPEQKAVISLIEAAPELLEAAKAFLAWIESGKKGFPSERKLNAAVDKAQAGLAKANLA